MKRQQPLTVGAACLCLLLPGLAIAQDRINDHSQGSDTPLVSSVKDFLRMANADAPGEVSIKVNTPSARMQRCNNPSPFFPGSGRRTSGQLTVGVHCPGDMPETRYVQADVSVIGTYYVAAHSIKPGTTLSAADISTARGNIARLSDRIATAPDQLVGQQAVRRIGAHMPILTDMVAPADLIHRGDAVDVVAQGRGFAITTRGKALDDAPAGSQIRVETANGTTLTGVPRDAHTVIVSP
ncbi:MAG: flagellar basal body P-ring formation chaperone FlgA [Salinisphaera sp.]|jgi:flagella basal body P-ring formation protein FlgA|nr:flagellar basal body P-ring formation chaperone FlgA [Salinisphaera sp.]